ncbi:MAG: hypothetical protein ACYCS7_17245 [Acidimicrobiales bacterium]
MMKLLRGLFVGSSLLIGLGLAGCGGGDLDPGVPKDAGYVPPPKTPNMWGDGKKPTMGVTGHDRKAGLAEAAAADAAALKNPPPK